MSNSMNTQDRQSELEGLVADIIGDARSIDVGFVADETSKYQTALNEGVKTIEAYVTTRVKEGRRAIELQAAANAYYEVADLLDELPHLYQKAMKKRQVALEEMTSLTTTTNGKIGDE